MNVDPAATDKLDLDEQMKALRDEVYEWGLAGDWEEVSVLLAKLDVYYSLFMFPPPPPTSEDVRNFSIQIPTGPLL